MNIQNNLNSIKVHQNWLNTNANNVANVSNNQYKQDITTIIEDQNSNVTAYDTKAKEQTNLTKEIPEQNTIQNATEANEKVIRNKDDMFGTILDIKA